MLITLFSSFFLGQFVTAETDLWQTKDLISKEAQKLAEIYQPSAKVIAHPTFGKFEIELPSVPFLVTKSRHTKVESVISKIDYIIYGNDGELNESLKAELGKLAKAYSANSSFSYTAMVLEKQSLSRFEKTSQTLAKHWIFSIGGIIVVCAFFIAFVSLMASRKVQTSGGSIKAAIENLAKNMVSESEDEPLEKLAKPLGDNTASDGEVASFDDETSFINQMHKDSLIAFFWDCYWAEKDSSGSFVWNRVLPDLRGRILEQSPQLTEYFSSLGDVSEKANSEYRESSYLQPLDISFISNSDLTKFVLKNPSAYPLLPNLRKENLSISGMEMLGLEKKLKATMSLEDLQGHLKKLKPSEPRHFDLRKELPILSLDDESQLIAINGLELEDKGRIRSLAWILEMHQDEQEKLLKQLSAQNLAEAWVGPQDVLDKLESVLPEKKLKMLKSYQKRVSSSRYSESFSYLFEASLDYLKNRSEEEGTLDEKISA